MKLLRSIKTTSMMKFVFLLLITFTFSNCKTLFRSGKGNTNTVDKRVKRFNDGSWKDKGPDTIVPKGVQYIPLYGKRESGVNRDIEGSWELESMDGYVIKSEAVKKLDSLEQTKLKRVTKDGANFVYSKDPKITPPQGSRYHIPERPSISFYGANETFSGFTGCNRYSGRYVMPDSSTISLTNAAPSTRMVCLGDYDEGAYLDNLHRVSKFRGTDDKLELLEGDRVILTFTRKNE